MSIGMDDRQWMLKAISLAEGGRGSVEPNPMVGCVVVQNGIQIAGGFHQRFGGPHAEVEALGGIDRESVRGATVYVTLEPCSHFGKTPPCAPLVASMNPSRVVVAMRDPFPQVAGAGIEYLRKCGIEVEVGVCESEAEQLNAPYLKLLRTKHPWVIAKWAMTLDGYIATRVGDSKWITSEPTRDFSHRRRGNLDAILIGIGTALKDDPILTPRCPSPNRIPVRVVLDRLGRLPLKSRLVQSITPSQPLWVIVSQDSPDEKNDMLREVGAKVLIADRDVDTLDFAIQRLGEHRFTNVMIEGGSRVLGSAFERNLIDQIECYIAPKAIGGNGMPPIGGAGCRSMECSSRWYIAEHERIGDDLFTMYRKQR